MRSNGQKSVKDNNHVSLGPETSPPPRFVSNGIDLVMHQNLPGSTPG